MAYEWCSEICKGYRGLEDGEELLFFSLQIGFRGLDLRDQGLFRAFVHTNHHGYMRDIVFRSGDDEAVADLLYAWTTPSYTPYEFLNTWPRHFVRLRPATITSERLRRLVIHSVGYINFREVGDVEVGELTALLDRLSINIDDMYSPVSWLHLLLYLVQSPEGRRSLSHPYWELMVELAADESLFQNNPINYNQQLQVMFSLEEEKGWDMLECWCGFVWLRRCPRIGTITGDLERTTLSLLRQRPGAVKKLERWIQRLRMGDARECLECLRWICDRGGLEAVSQKGIS
jgi:hypothetical protein